MEIRRTDKFEGEDDTVDGDRVRLSGRTQCDEFSSIDIVDVDCVCGCAISIKDNRLQRE